MRAASARVVLAGLALALGGCGVVSTGVSTQFGLAWVAQFGSGGFESAAGVVAGSGSEVRLAGTTTGSLPGQTTAGGRDYYVVSIDQAGGLATVRQRGTSATESIGAYGASVVGFNLTAGDDLGNFYVAGVTGGALFALSAGSDDLFLAKYDSAGNLLWGRQIGSAGADDVQALAVDGDGNAYLSGHVRDALPGQTHTGTVGVRDAFLIKYDASGELQWIEQFGTTDEDGVNQITLDAAGDVYLGGYTNGSFPGFTGSGNYDCYAAKYLASGSPEWLTQMVGTASCGNAFLKLATDTGGVTYLAGTMGGYFPGLSTHLGSSDAYIVGFDSTTGGVLWALNVGTSSFEAAIEVAQVPGGGIYLAGNTGGAFPGQTSGGGTDAFLARVSPSGVLTWARQVGGAGTDATVDVRVGSSGDVYLAGTAGAALPGQSSAGMSDAFLARFDSSGTRTFLAQFGTAGEELATHLAVDGGDAVVIGTTTGFFPGQTSYGETDAFAALFR
jgi:hypothetical protein